MTTKITVDAHAGWPVNVKVQDRNANNDGWSEGQTETVAPNETRDFHVWDTRRLVIEEGERG